MFKRLLLCFTLLLAVAGAKADDAYWTLTFPASEQESVSSYAITWTASMTDGGAWNFYGFNNNNSGWAYIRCGNKSVAYNEDNTDAGAAYIATTTAAEQAIGEVVVTVDKVTTTDLYKDPYLVVATDADFSDVVETVTLSTDDLAAGDWTFAINDATENAYYKLVFNMNKTSSNGTLQISQVVYYEAEASESAECDTIYIVGNKDNAWGSMSASDNYDVLVEAVAGSKVYYNEALEVSLSSNTTGWFAFYTELDPTWSGDPKLGPSSANETITVGTAQTLISTSNSFQYDSETVGTYSVTVDLSDEDNMTVLFASASDDDDEEDDAELGVIYLLGASNDWTMAATNVNLTETEAGSKIYYNEAVTFTAEDYIAIYTQIDSSWGLTYRYAGYSSGEAIALNTETTLYNNATLGWETSFYISTAGTYAVTVDMSDSTNMTILIYDDSYTVALPNNLYFFGNDGVWSTTAHAGELTQTSEGIWEGEMTVTSGYFTLIDTISETDDDWTTINAHRYYPADNSTITLGDSSSMGYGADGSWSIDNGTYDVVVNCNTLKLIVTEQSEEEEETTVDTLTVAEAVALIEASENTSDSVYVKGIVSQIDSVYYTYYGNANYYISDDGTTDSQFYIYRGLGLGGASFTSADDLLVGDTLILYGVLTSYNSTPEMAAKNYIVYQGRPESTTEDEETAEPDTIYIVGNKDNAWGSMSADDNYDVLVEAVAGSGIYYNEALEVSLSSNTTGWFAFYTELDPTWSGDPKLGPSTANETITVGTAQTLISTSNSFQYDSETVGTYSVTVDLSDADNMTVLFALASDEEEEEEETTIDTLTVAEAIALINASENTSDSVYVKGIVSQIDSVYYTYYGNANYYISDDGSTDSQFYIYRGLGLGGASFTSADDLLVGDTLIVYGVLTLYNTTPEMAAKNYIVYQGRPESTDDDDEEEDTTTYDVYAKTSEITSGQSYLIVVQDGTNTMYATNHNASYTYGYIYTNTVSGLVDTISVDASEYNAFVITASETTDGAYTIQDSYGRYLYQSGTYKSFNLSSTNDSYDWTIVANEDGTWTITYASSSYWMQYSTSYSSFGVYSTDQSGLLPYLYELVSSDEEDDGDDTGDDTGDGDDDGDDTGDGDEDGDEEETAEVVGYYVLATSTDELSDGDTITIASTSYSVAIGAIAESGTYFGYTTVSISDDTLAATADVLEIILEADGEYWKLRLTDDSYLYACSTSSNQMGATTETQTDGSDVASISIEQDETTLSYDATILFQRSDSERTLIQYNNGTSGRFSCYRSDGSSNQNPVQIYRKVVAETEDDDTETGIATLSNEASQQPQHIYTISGMKLNSLDNAPAGIYIVDGVKVLVK